MEGTDIAVLRVPSRDHGRLCQYRLVSSPPRYIYSGQRLPVAAGVVAGGLAWIGVGLLGLFLLRTGWRAYAAAEPTKEYTFAMLLSRLALASVCSISSGFLAVTTTGQDLKPAWWLGAILLLGSMPRHLPISYFNVWADYPVWYHTVYLLSLIPLTGFGGCLAKSALQGATKER